MTMKTMDGRASIWLAPFVPAACAQRVRAWLGKGQRDRALADLDEALKLDTGTKVSGSSDDPIFEFFFLGSTRPRVEALRDELRAKLPPNVSYPADSAPQAQ